MPYFPKPSYPYKPPLFSVTAAQATYHAPPHSTAGYAVHGSYAESHHRLTHARAVGHHKARAHHPRIHASHVAKPHHPKHHTTHHQHLPPGVEYQPF